MGKFAQNSLLGDHVHTLHSLRLAANKSLHLTIMSRFGRRFIYPTVPLWTVSTGVARHFIWIQLWRRRHNWTARTWPTLPPKRWSRGRFRPPGCLRKLTPRPDESAMLRPDRLACSI